MNKTGISWTDLTWNPISGCTKVSEGCKFCYAEAWSRRWHRSFEVTLHPEKLDEVRKIPSGSKVFVNSMSDLFHPKVPSDFIVKVFWKIFEITAGPYSAQLLHPSGDALLLGLFYDVSRPFQVHRSVVRA